MDILSVISSYKQETIKAITAFVFGRSDPGAFTGINRFRNFKCGLRYPGVCFFV